MGRTFEPSTSPGFYLWNLEKTEEIVLLASLLSVKNRIPKTDEWLPVFEGHFWKGRGVAETTFSHLNTYLKRVGLREIYFEETHPLDDYARFPNFDTRASHRNELLLDLETKTPEQLSSLLTTEWKTVDELPLPHRTYAEFLEVREKRKKLSSKAKSVITDAGEAPSQKPTLNSLSPLNIKQVCTFEDIRWLIEQTTDHSIKDELVRKAVSMMG